MLYTAIVDWSLRHRVLVLVASVILLIIGLRTTPSLQVDVLPELAPPTVSVHVEAAGLSPQDIEAQISVPLEAALAGLPDVVRVRSASSPALALVYAEFAWGSDPYRSRQLVAERLDAARSQLPPGVQPRIGPMASLMGEVMLIALHADADALDPMAVRDLADWQLRPALLAVPGVAQVIAIGGEQRQLEIRPDPQRMSLLGVRLDEIEAAARGFGVDAGAGFIDDHGQDLALRLGARPLDLDALGDLAVSWRGRAPIRLRQVADIAIGARPQRGTASADAKPAVILAVQKQQGADTLRLSAALDARLAVLRTSLPDAVQATVLFRQADFIEKSVDNVREALWIGAVIVAIVLLAFLASGRATLVSLTAIPLSLLTAILVLRGFGLSINTMTLGGLAIAIGELVDDAVVGVENIARRLRLRGPQASPLKIIADATVEVRSGVLYATLLVVLVLVPVFALGGIEGRLFTSLAIAYIAAILASLIVAVTVSPVLASFAFAGREVHAPQEHIWLRHAKTRYLAGLDRVLLQPRRALLAALLLLLVALVVGAQLPRSFLPGFNEGTLTVNLVLKPGIALSESDRVGRLAEALILDVPEVAHVGRRTGRAELDEHAEGVHYSEIDVALRDEGRERSAVIAEIYRRLAVLPGEISIGQPISHRLDHLLSGVRAPLVIKLIGDDRAVLHQLAEDVRARLAALPGLARVQIEKQDDVPLLDIRVDPRRAGQYGLSQPQVQRTLAELAVGKPLSQLVEQERRYELVLRLPEAARTAEALRLLPLDSPAGPVPLGWIADIEASLGPNQILRENLRRRLVVSAFPQGTGFAGADRAAQDLLAEYPLPPGYELRVEGQILAQQEALRHLAGLGVLSLLLMLTVLYARYRSLRLSAIVLASVPLALIGGALALAVTGTPLSVASVIGFVTLAGIAARNGILKISHFIHLQQHEGEHFGVAVVRRGAEERLTPVLITALIAALALIPLLVAPDAPGKEILHPVSLVIFGGLISSTVLDSFLTPALYLLWGEAPTRRLLEKKLPWRKSLLDFLRE